VGTLVMLLMLHAAPVALALILGWQLRHGEIWVYFGLRSARRATEPLAYWLGIAGICLALLLAVWIVGNVDLAILRSRGWL